MEYVLTGLAIGGGLYLSGIIISLLPKKRVPRVERDLESYRAQVQLLVQKYEKEATAAHLAYVDLERRTEKRLLALELTLLATKDVADRYSYARAGVSRLVKQEVPEVFYKGYKHPTSGDEG
jgi:hypothetical protein